MISPVVVGKLGEIKPYSKANITKMFKYIFQVPDLGQFSFSSTKIMEVSPNLYLGGLTDALAEDIDVKRKLARILKYFLIYRIFYIFKRHFEFRQLVVSFIFHLNFKKKLYSGKNMFFCDYFRVRQVLRAHPG